MQGRFIYLEEMYNDNYFPNFLVEKIQLVIEEMVHYLQQGEHSVPELQARFDEMVGNINELQDEFVGHGSELETVARVSIAATVEQLLITYHLTLNLSDAPREKEW